MDGLPMEPTLVVEIVALRKCCLFRMVEVVLMAQCFHLNEQISGWGCEKIVVANLPFLVHLIGHPYPNHGH